jgi:lysophospholipid acyltransferase (LPLAT)-like uncharacterized protein
MVKCSCIYGGKRMPKKEKIKYFLYLILTPLIIAVMTFIALTIKDKAIIKDKENDNSEVLNIINHSHNY